MISKNTFWRQGDAAVRRSARFLQTLFLQERQFPARTGRKRSSLHGEEGAEIVEFALTASILFAFVFGVMQICMAFYTHEYISELAREGARYASLRGSTCTIAPGGGSCEVTAAQVNAYVASIAWPNIGGGTFSAANVSTSYPNGETPGGTPVDATVIVTVTYQFPYHIPFVPQSTTTLRSTSQMTMIQ